MALVLPACFGGNDSGSSAPPTTTLPPTTASVSVASTAIPAATEGPNAAKAKAAVFQPEDFPPGFAPMPESDGGGLKIDTLWAELTGCLGVANRPGVTGVATSPTFLRGLATQARSTVEYTTPASANAVGDALGGPRFQQCATDAFRADVERSKPEGATAGTATVAPRGIAPVGQRTFAWRINASVFLQDLQVPLFQDFLVVVNGGTLIRLFFLNPGSEFPQELQRSLIEKVVARAA